MPGGEGTFHLFPRLSLLLLLARGGSVPPVTVRRLVDEAQTVRVGEVVDLLVQRAIAVEEDGRAARVHSSPSSRKLTCTRRGLRLSSRLIGAQKSSNVSGLPRPATPPGLELSQHGEAPEGA